MRRAILTILLYLMLGLVTSIAVAWVAAVGYQATDGYTREYLLFGQLQRAGRELEAVAVDRRPRQPFEWWSGDDRWGPFPAWSALNEPPTSDGQQISEFAAGWPVLCLKSVVLRESSSEHPFGWDRRGRIEGRIDLPWPRWEWERVDHLPATPIGPHLLVNVAFWAALWGVLASLRNLWRFNRSLRWRPRGRCGWCGYDLRKTPRDGVCPECGHEAAKPPRLFALPSWLGAMVVMLMMGLLFGASVSAFVLVVEQWPLHRAAFDGDVRTLDAQLAGGADINGVAQIRGARDATPLVLAIRAGQVETTKRLIDAGADVNLRCREGLPLIAAAEGGSVAIVRALLDAGANVSQTNGGTALYAAVYWNHIEIASILLVSGADVNAGGAWLPLYAARSTEMVDLLVEHGADINLTSVAVSPLARHVQNRNMDIARHLVERGATVDFAALRAALLPRRLRTLQYLVEHGGDLAATNPDGLSVWHLIDPRESAAELWEFIYRHNPEVNAATSQRIGGQTPLHNALDNYGGSISVEFVQFLLDHGADPRIPDANGRTAIDDAPSENIRQMLIEAAQKLEREEAERDQSSGD